MKYNSHNIKLVRFLNLTNPSEKYKKHLMRIYCIYISVYLLKYKKYLTNIQLLGFQFCLIAIIIS